MTVFLPKFQISVSRFVGNTFPVAHRYRGYRFICITNPYALQKASVKPELNPPDTHLFISVNLRDTAVRVHDQRRILQTGGILHQSSRLLLVPPFLKFVVTRNYPLQAVFLSLPTPDHLAGFPSWLWVLQPGDKLFMDIRAVIVRPSFFNEYVHGVVNAAYKFASDHVTQRRQLEHPLVHPLASS